MTTLRHERDLRRLRLRRNTAGRGRMLSSTDDGRIMIRSPSLFTGYRLRPDLTAEAVSERQISHPGPRLLGGWPAGRTRSDG